MSSIMSSFISMLCLFRPLFSRMFFVFVLLEAILRHCKLLHFLR
ncbi:unnamed protein product [Callosobruchus maculatus]|uniref:Uncharacterized protein n=1 Tax=Callosobruchus maculatus TaxID=64391 RepID=A0A653DKV6_CALMS|nr:unnamed protein product [Callosobruchus maculatus]